MDFKKLKFRAGLEIHQQLETHKLFCKCPSVLRDDEHNLILRRKLRAVSGETGEKDYAAKFEEKKDLVYVYEGYKDSTCAVEMDEEPPHELNKTALEISLQVCLLLKCKIVDEIQVMRKTVVDGSNTSGFQRTMLIGYDGILETTKGIVKIATVCLEEDAARKIKEGEKEVVYRLDRLGIPLIEVATETDIQDSEHAKEVAEKLGMILRSTGKVKRGLGTIRQDVNISINKGNRVELKGFQDLRSMPKVIEIEVERQKKNKVSKEVRKVNEDGTSTFLRPAPGAARMYPETDVKPVKITKELINSIKLPELIDEKVLKYEKLGLNSEISRSLVKENIDLDDFNYKIDKKLIARILIEIPKDIKTRFNLNYKFKESEFRFVLENLEKNLINKEAAFEIMVEIANGKKVDLNKYKTLDLKDVEEEIKKIVKNNPKLAVGGLMGIAMAKYRGKVDGKTIAMLIQKYSKV